MGNAFPWTTEGMTFRSLRHFEQSIETLATAGTRQHLVAAQELMRQAMAKHKLSADQYTEIKERLHL